MPKETEYIMPTHPDDFGGKEGLELTGPQQALYEVLVSKDVLMGRMYLDTLSALKHMRNQGGYPLAAHAIRELFEKLPRYLDVELKAHNEGLKSEVRKLEKSWEIACEKSPRLDEGILKDRIHRSVHEYHKNSGGFFRWFKGHHPRRRDEVRDLLSRLDSGSLPIPKPLEKLNIDVWQEMRDFFISVAHYGHQTDQEEFNLWLGALERFLLDRLIPRTFDNLAEIRKIIQEGEADA